MTPDALATLHRAAFSDERAWAATEFESLLASAHTHLTTAPHGFALWRAVAGEAELLTIATHPDHRRRGTARALMQRWMATASTQADTAFLEVAADNAAAIALYDAFGFKQMARRPDYYKRAATSVDALVMRAPLPFSDLEKSSGESPE